MAENKVIIPSFEEYLGAADESEENTSSNETENVRLSLLREFAGHPFNVLDDNSMDELVESIKQHGVLTPILIRPAGDDGFYEIISGHRRVHASKRAGLSSVPAIIREMSDDDAVITMVDANIQREEILPSEKARAFKMKYDAMSHQGIETSGHDVPKLTCEIVGESANMSGRQVKRYIRLLELIPEWLSCVDQKKLQFVAGVEMSYLNKDVQKFVWNYTNEVGTINTKAISKLHSELGEQNASKEEVYGMLNCILGKPVGDADKGEELKLKGSVLRSYFPPGFPSEMWEDIILYLLGNWREERMKAENGEL